MLVPGAPSCLQRNALARGCHHLTVGRSESGQTSIPDTARHFILQPCAYTFTPPPPTPPSRNNFRLDTAHPSRSSLSLLATLASTFRRPSRHLSLCPRFLLSFRVILVGCATVATTDLKP